MRLVLVGGVGTCLGEERELDGLSNCGFDVAGCEGEAILTNGHLDGVGSTGSGCGSDDTGCRETHYADV